jgi:hypothetical protein
MAFTSENFHAVAVFEGILLGISADNEINVAELKTVKAWLDKNVHMGDLLPFGAFYNLIERVQSTGEISKMDHDFLLRMCTSFRSTQNVWPTVEKEIVENLKSIFGKLWRDFAEHIREDLFISKALFHLNIPVREYSSLFLVASRALEAFCVQTLIRLKFVMPNQEVRFSRNFKFANNKTIDQIQDSAFKHLYWHKMRRALEQYRHPFLHGGSVQPRLQQRNDAESTLGEIMDAIIDINRYARNYRH